MSREIRTPMNAIIGLSQLALRTDLDEQQRDFVDKIDAASRHLLGIINDILDFSRIEAGKLAPEHIDFDLEHTFGNVANVVNPAAQQKGIELLYAIDPSTPSWVKGDPLRLGQVLINLLNNAIKFTEQGHVRLTVRPTEDAGAPDDSVRLYVEVETLALA